MTTVAKQSTKIISRKLALMQKVAQLVHGLGHDVAELMPQRVGNSGGCERARASASELLSAFVSDCGAAALSSAAIRSRNQYSAALTIASRVGV